MLALLEQHRQVIADLCRRYRIARLELFGAAATEEFDPSRHEIEFLIEYLPDTDLGPWLAQFDDLEQALRAILGSPVRLVMSRAPAMSNRYFVQELNRTRKLVFAA